MIPVAHLARRAGAVALLLSLAACAPKSYTVKAPTASALKYELVSTAASTQLSFLDERKGEDRTFSSGTLPAALTSDKGPLDPLQFLSQHVGEELASRGLPVRTANTDQGQPKVHVKTFNVLNHRSSGFSPFFTFTYLSADLETAKGTKRVGVFVRRGKVPVWSFDEVVEPTFNQPLSIAVKEFASKVANYLYSYRASDATVKDLIAKVSGAPTPDTYLDVYALGFSNNPLAVDTLVKLTSSTDEYVRLAAISSLGNVGATSQFGLLESIYQKGDSSAQDKDMAIKAIADLGTPEALAFVSSELKRLSSQNDRATLFTTRVLALYL